MIIRHVSLLMLKKWHTLIIAERNCLAEICWFVLIRFLGLLESAKMSIFKANSKHDPKSYEEVLDEADKARMRADVFEVSPSMSSSTPIFRESEKVMSRSAEPPSQMLTQFLLGCSCSGHSRATWWRWRNIWHI